jgi:RHS repeat-associated protein
MTDPNGLYYMRARYYHPSLKRFLNRDLIRGDISDGQTFNRYAYVNGDPVKYVDPLGLFKCEFDSGTSKLDDDAYVVRGGTNKAEQFTNGSGVTTGSDGS